ncbi:hypothetical protein ACTJKE_33265 [Ensifer sp. 22521]|uniref:hypothetical protein n=1 Tax=Ensifer sp. 22521 TaxID=3453935 RepID=UPI003F85E930
MAADPGSDPLKITPKRGLADRTPRAGWPRFASGHIHRSFPEICIDSRRWQMEANVTVPLKNFEKLSRGSNFRNEVDS